MVIRHMIIRTGTESAFDTAVPPSAFVVSAPNQASCRELKAETTRFRLLVLKTQGIPTYYPELEFKENFNSGKLRGFLRLRRGDFGPGYAFFGILGRLGAFIIIILCKMIFGNSDPQT